MASGWRGVAAGSLALLALETLVQPSASGRVAGLFGLPGSWARKFLDPSVPAFHSGKASSGGGDWGATPSSSTTSTPTVTPATSSTPAAKPAGTTISI